MSNHWIAVFEDCVFENYLPQYESSEGCDVDTFIIGIELAEL
jgi:hypothetical protein